MTQSYSEYRRKARDHAREKAAKNDQWLYSLLHTPRLRPYQRMESDQDWIRDWKSLMLLAVCKPWKREIRLVWSQNT